MKLILAAIICFVLKEATTQLLESFNNCPKAKEGEPKAPTEGKYFQVLRFSKLSSQPEVAKCRKVEFIINADKSLTLNQSVVGPFDVALNQTFVAKPNVSGYWDVSENAKPSSTIFLDASSEKYTILYTCSFKNEAIMPLVEGVYSQNKALSSDEVKKVAEELKNNNFTEYEIVDHSSCKN